MKKSLVWGLVIAGLCTSFMPVSYAGTHTDALSRCLVNSTSTQDKVNLMRWIMVSVAQHPNLKNNLTVNQTQLIILTKNTASIFERLLTVSCVKPMQQVLKYEGNAALRNSFETLGEVVTKDLISDPKVTQALGDYYQYINKNKIEKAVRPAK